MDYSSKLQKVILFKVWLNLRKPNKNPILTEHRSLQDGKKSQKYSDPVLED